jgi:hypothetical protein
VATLLPPTATELSVDALPAGGAVFGVIFEHRVSKRATSQCQP